MTKRTAKQTQESKAFEAILMASQIERIADLGRFVRHLEHVQLVDGKVLDEDDKEAFDFACYVLDTWAAEPAKRRQLAIGEAGHETMKDYWHRHELASA